MTENTAGTAVSPVVADRRQWRVGTWSMGLALLAAGCALLVSSLGGADAFVPLTLWWPVLLIVLGGEILLYLSLQRQAAPILKFDVVSIVLLSLIGAAGLGLAGLQQTGVLEEVRSHWKAEERLLTVPPFREKVPADIKKLVIRTERAGSWPIYVNSSADRSLHLSATLRVSGVPDAPEPKWLSSLFLQETVGDTLYVTVRFPPRDGGWGEDPVGYDVMMAVPGDMPVEFHAYRNALEFGGTSDLWTVKP